MNAVPGRHGVVTILTFVIQACYAKNQLEMIVTGIIIAYQDGTGTVKTTTHSTLDSIIVKGMML